MIGRFIESALNAGLANPTALAVIAVSSVVLVAVWYSAQVQETREGEALRRSERERPDSIWNQ